MKDPYILFHEWLESNGFNDVIECEPEDCNMDRLSLAVDLYSLD